MLQITESRQKALGEPPVTGGKLRQNVIEFPAHVRLRQVEHPMDDAKVLLIGRKSERPQNDSVLVRGQTDLCPADGDGFWVEEAPFHLSERRGLIGGQNIVRLLHL